MFFFFLGGGVMKGNFASKGHWLLIEPVHVCISKSNSVRAALIIRLQAGLQETIGLSRLVNYISCAAPLHNLELC